MYRFVLFPARFFRRSWQLGVHPNNKETNYSTSFINSAWWWSFDLQLELLQIPGYIMPIMMIIIESLTDFVFSCFSSIELFTV